MGGLERVPGERSKQSPKLTNVLAEIMVLNDLKNHGVVDFKHWDI